MTNWTPATTTSTGYSKQATSSVWDSAGSWDGGELSATDADLTWDGYRFYPSPPTHFTPQSTNTTAWS